MSIVKSKINNTSELLVTVVEDNIDYKCGMHTWCECALWYELPELPDENMLWGDTQNLISKHLIMVCDERND